MILVDDVLVELPEKMEAKEASQYVTDEIKHWKAKGKTLGKVVLEADGSDIIIKAYEKSPIRRIRRITGYLSEVSNFNDAKRAELAGRVIHA